MLRVLGSRRALCDGLTRRDLLHAGTLGFLSLSDWFRLRAAQAATPSSVKTSFGQAKSCILLFLFGSPSQHDTFDAKPQAPGRIRGELKPIPTSIPGLHICELLPNIARTCQRTTIVRSLTHPYPVHGVAYAVTGIPAIDAETQLSPRDSRHWPFIGSVVQYLDERRRGRPTGQAPANIALPWPFSTRRDHPARNAGPFGHFLGSAYDPIWTEFQGQATRKYFFASSKKELDDPYAGIGVDDCFPLAGAATTLPPDVTLSRLNDRQTLLAELDQAARRWEGTQAVRDLDRFRQQAHSLTQSAATRRALDISREPLAGRERYGMTLFGQATLAARRLVEAGSRFVTVFWDDYLVLGNQWDTHADHFPRMRQVLCPGLDRTWTALLDDLEARGLLEETVVACISEHGRTPEVKDRPGGGRDHWSRAYSAILAGGGIARGRVVGQTDRLGGEVADTPISPKDILATIYHLLGIDPSTTIPDRLGRPLPVGGEGEVRSELLA